MCLQTVCLLCAEITTLTAAAFVIYALVPSRQEAVFKTGGDKYALSVWMLLSEAATKLPFE